MLTLRFEKLGLQSGRPVARCRRRIRPSRLRGGPIAVLASLRSTTRPRRSPALGRPSARWPRLARSPGIDYVGVLRGDATKLPFADGTFDRVITSEVLEHIQDDVDRDLGTRSCAPPRRHARGHGAELVSGEDQLAAVGRVLRAEVGRRARPDLLADRTQGQDPKGRIDCRRFPPRPRAALAVLVAEMRGRPDATTTTRLVDSLPQVLGVGHHQAAEVDEGRREGAVASDG